MNPRLFLTEILMTPIHALEGLSVRHGFARPLYRKMSSVYRLGRPFFYFGEDYFEKAVTPGDRVLELGSGTGYLSRRLSRRAGMMTGLELEKPMLKKASRDGGRVAYVAGDMTRVPFRDGGFDRCVSLGAIHCVDPKDFFREAARVLRPGGKAMVLSETGIIPRYAPRATREAIRRGIEESGMKLIEEINIGRLYTIFVSIKGHSIGHRA
jgi:ubiquinone/menaquinone biosynthesis C-methylase UbiE